jgi:hypothetical protein
MAISSHVCQPQASPPPEFAASAAGSLTVGCLAAVGCWAGAEERGWLRDTSA